MEKKKIEEFLAKGGFLFEFECIKMFEKFGFSIQPSLHYVDALTNDFREVDFIAYKTIYYEPENFSFNVSLVVECKSHMSPLIATSTNSLLQKELVASNLLGSKNTSNLRKKLELSGGLDSFLFGLEKGERIAQNIIEYTTKESKKAGKDRVFQAMMQSINACNYLKKSSNESDARFANIYIPVVIFDNEIFIINNDEKDLNIENIDRVKASKFYAFNEHPYNVFHIISKHGLEAYCDQAAHEIDEFILKYEPDIKQIVKDNPNNSGSGQYHISSL